MGATNSKPQTVQMSNPMPFEITRDVVHRIDQATTRTPKLGTTICEKCSQRPAAEAASDPPTTVEHKTNEVQDMHPLKVAKSWKRRSFEVEETEFKKSVQRVQGLFGKPVKWAKDCQGEIGKFEEELIHCYQRYPNEPLQCSNLARQYHRFVFARQVDEISKMRGLRAPADPKSPSNVGKAGKNNQPT
ncbi:uncharacterized protein LOC108032928 [Drosophila biarmipes]|uniref:uncharacterized protein LOC108032928 n=1 Tax=Drosophila biarmipes TaxID=125945 RepID=UPI0007E5EFC6|nr:uncharacterized protein LOC108032928 [Drosophila biarmipes]